MASLLKRRGPSQFERAADGSMTLIEHLRELRSRLFKASLAILAGFVVGFLLRGPVRTLLQKPYCDLPTSRDPTTGRCTFVQLGPADVFLLDLKIALWVGLLVAAPIWFYQLWAFIAPGLHRHERKYAYAFVSIATPLFLLGALLAYFVVEKGLIFLLQFSGDDITTNLEITRYISFVTNLILIFGVAFEFPLVALMLNVVGAVSGRRLLSWWRMVVFVFFVFSAIVTPTPDPFGMTALAVALSLLYFAAVGVALLNDRRRRRHAPDYSNLDDDQMSPLAYDRDAVEEPVPVAPPAPLDAQYDDPSPVTRRGYYDDMT